MSPYSKIWVWLQLDHTHFLTMHLEPPLLKFLDFTPATSLIRRVTKNYLNLNSEMNTSVEKHNPSFWIKLKRLFAISFSFAFLLTKFIMKYFMLERKFAVKEMKNNQTFFFFRESSWSSSDELSSKCSAYGSLGSEPENSSIFGHVADHSLFQSLINKTKLTHREWWF